MTSTDEDRFQLAFDEDHYANVVLDGVDAHAEASNRLWAATLLVDACVLLRLPRVTCATAQVLMHRYFCRVRMSGHDRLLMTTFACLFLATKIEETRRKVRDILSVFFHLLNKMYNLPDTTLDVASNHYNNWRNALLKNETAILSTLGFMVYTSHPHKFLLSYIQRLNGGQVLAQTSWNYINDFQTSVDCLRFGPEAIASASIMLAARELGMPLPSSPPWYELFGSTKAELEHICVRMASIDRMGAPTYHPLSDADRVDFSKIEEDNRQTIKHHEEMLRQASAPSNGACSREADLDRRTKPRSPSRSPRHRHRSPGRYRSSSRHRSPRRRHSRRSRSRDRRGSPGRDHHNTHRHR
ncbi:hypothetical protein PBRA_007193 [Plasmodiophora brassicae]|uniref:Cyclin-like domain-containing protein n=1 Tax=Plasmodiophora brassicae TaxID=37360 RepID=A0A0G4IV90_PLABS|nr:hypothetical protein PBRA_007193 [Plasmodiophora brassicae]